MRVKNFEKRVFYGQKNYLEQKNSQRRMLIRNNPNFKLNTLFPSSRKYKDSTRYLPLQESSQIHITVVQDPIVVFQCKT